MDNGALSALLQRLPLRRHTVSALVFTVPGVAVPQGSKTAYRAAGRTVLVEANRALRPWRAAITTVAKHAATQQGWQQTTDPVHVALQFHLPMPKSSRYAWPTSKRTGDVDKLARAVLDACTDAGIWLDDSQVVELHASKVWATTTPHAVVEVTQ